MAQEKTLQDCHALAIKERIQTASSVCAFRVAIIQSGVETANLIVKQCLRRRQ
jgi:hypothetical protein